MTGKECMPLCWADERAFICVGSLKATSLREVELEKWKTDKPSLSRAEANAGEAHRKPVKSRHFRSVIVTEKNNVAKATGEETTGICATDEDIKTLDIGIVLAPQVLEHLGTTRESSEIVPIIESTEETHRERGVDQSKMT
ncbi:hypothetical protein LguiA_000712 [Lonicera macranthoides]